MQINDRVFSLADHASKDQLPVELAELQAKAEAAETALIASAIFSDRAGSMVRKDVLKDWNRRVMRQANVVDDLYARAILKAYGTATYGDTLTGEITLQCKACERRSKYNTAKAQALYAEDPAEFVFMYCKNDRGRYNRCVNCRCIAWGGVAAERFIGMKRSTLRDHRDKLRAAGIITVLDSVREGPGALDPGRIRGHRFSYQPGLALARGALIWHDFNAALPDDAPQAGVRECKQCGADLGLRKGSAECCSPACKQKFYRAQRKRVTESRHGTPHGTAHGTPQWTADILGSTKTPNSPEVVSSSMAAAPRDDDPDDEISGEKLISSPSAQSGVGMSSSPRSTRSKSTARSSSSRPRAERDDTEVELWTDIISPSMPDFQRRALVNRAREHGLDMEEVDAMLVNFLCGRLKGFRFPDLRVPGVMTYLPKMVQAHRAWESNREEHEAAEAKEWEREREARAAQAQREAESAAKAAAAEEKRAESAAIEARLDEAVRLEEEHREGHADHYGPCGECAGCQGVRGDGRCIRPVHQADCGHDLGEGVEVTKDRISLSGHSHGVSSQHLPRVYLHGQA